MCFNGCGLKKIKNNNYKAKLHNYKNNIARLEQLKVQLRKTIRDYGYIKNDYIGEE